jgi:hypothetical protein
MAEGGWDYDPDTGLFDQSPIDTGGGSNWLSSILSALGPAASVIGPILKGGASLVGGNIAANASQDAAAAQTSALNRGFELQTAQWLQQQANQAPWLQAGQQALPELQKLAGQAAPTLQQAAPIRGTNAPMPGTTPGWQPSLYAGYQQTATPSAAQYAYQPGQGPRAGDYRYTPGAQPQAGQYGYQGPQAVQAEGYRWTPGQGPRAQDYRYTPGDVPTLSGQDLLANDPGVQFRLQEGRNALEASAAARGGALSGPAMAALQRQGQELSSQEYGNAWQRASQQAQMREQWQQVATQQGWSQAQTEAAFREQMAQQASQQGFAQALSGQGQQWQQGMTGAQYDWQRAQQATQLREQLNQVASQQGWSQAQTEAAFREQMAQTASAQNWGQAANEAELRAQQQQFGWNAGFQTQQQGQKEAQSYEQQLYDRLMQQNQTQYGRDWQQREAENQRMADLYNSQRLSQSTAWNQQAALAGYGQQAAEQLRVGGQNTATQQANLLSQQGTAQGTGAAGEGLAWTRALTGVANQFPGVLAGLNR